MEEDSHSSQTEYQETEPQSPSKFSKSLQELKDLCSQLHAAAGYSESTFLNSNHKHLVVESTKEYVCRAVVAVVDHLGTVSANLDHHISQAETETISQSEVRINLLKQKLFICQEYSDKLALTRLTWRPDIPRYNSRYLKPPVSDILSQNSRSEIVANTENTKQGFKIDEEVPLFFYTCIYKSSPKFGESENDDKATVSLSLPGRNLISGVKRVVFVGWRVQSDTNPKIWHELEHDLNSKIVSATCTPTRRIRPEALPVRDNLSNQPKPQAALFQLQEKRSGIRGALFRKSMTSNEILSIIRRRK